MHVWLIVSPNFQSIQICTKWYVALVYLSELTQKLLTQQQEYILCFFTHYSILDL